MHSSAMFKNLANTSLFQVPYRPKFGLSTAPLTCPRRAKACANMNKLSSESESRRPKKPMDGPSAKSKSPRPKKPYGYWKPMSNVLSELELFLSSQNPRPVVMPTARELADVGLQDLAGAIRRHTWRKVAKAANLPMSSIANPRSLNLSYCTNLTTKRLRPYMYWHDWDNVEREIREYIREHGGETHENSGKGATAMPTASDLVDHGRSDLKRAVLMHGGTRLVAKRMGLAPKSRPVDYWNEENVVEELTRVAKCTGREGDFPSLQDMRKFGARGLPSAVKKVGGARALAAKMGLTLRRKPQKR